MALKDKISNFIAKIKNKYNELSTKQKLVTVTLGVFVLIVIVKLFYLTSNVGIEYQNFNIALETSIMSRVTDNNLYVTLVSISKDFLDKSTQYFNGKEVEVKDIYDTILTDEYTEYLTKRKFKDIYEGVLEKSNKIMETKGELIPKNIFVDEEGKYIIEYSCKNDGVETNIYIGIQLNTAYNKYYVWYLE